MSSVEIASTADAAAGGSTKRPVEDAAVSEQPELKKLMPAPPQTAGPETTTPSYTTKVATTAPPAASSKAREIRLEQNRKAARESRRRKKVMIEELQRSVIFFSRANGTLKLQNDELSRLLLQAQAQVKKGTTENNAAASAAKEEEKKPAKEQSQQEQQAQAQAVATQAMFETQGFPAQAARAAAQTLNSGALPPMQPGATMQAMANFQQAAAAAMQAAMQGMHGVNAMHLAVTPAPGQNAQQAFTDTMTALAMQQAAAAHMGAFMGHQQQMQLQQQQQQTGAAPAAAVPQPGTPAAAAPQPGAPAAAAPQPGAPAAAESPGETTANV